MATALFVKNSILCVGPDLDASIPVTVPRDAGMGAPALVWGVDRTTFALNPLAIDSDGKLGISFSGSITLGAVTIKDATTSDNLDVIAGEGGTISTDNFRGLLTYGAWNDSGTLKTKLLHMDSNGNLNVNLASSTASPSPLVALDTLDLTGGADSTTLAPGTSKFKIKAILLHAASAISQTVTIKLVDAAVTTFVLGTQSFISSQDIAWYPDVSDLNFLATDSIVVECTGGVAVTVKTSIRYELV